MQLTATLAYGRIGMVAAMFAIVATACAAPVGLPGQAGGAPGPGAPKRVVAAMHGTPLFVPSSLNSGGGGRIDGNAELNGLTSAGLVVQQASGKWAPLLAEAVPDVDNGLWRILPDGRMETTWKIRENARWHDGTPIVGQDFVFTARLAQDPEMPWLVDKVYQYIDRVEAPDPRTVKVSWNQAYVRADQVTFSPLYARHVLEEPYSRADKQNISTLSFWTSDFVGSGPFKVKGWAPDSHVTLSAFDQFVLGRPKIDELEVRFIPDENATAANLLAGAVDFTLGPGLSLEQGMQVRDRWPEGSMTPGPSGNISMNAQFLNPDPPILLNPTFRKALYTAIDRQQLVDELLYGLSQVLHVNISPYEAEYPFIEPAIVKYSFDPGRAAATIEQLGYSKGADGMFADSSGKTLSIQIMATTDDNNAKPQAAILDMWRQIGITPDLEPVTQQRQRDLEYRANFRSFSLQSGIGFGADGVNSLLTREMRTAERSFVGNNYTRFSNPEIDALVTRYFTTIPWTDRMQALSQLVRYTTENLIWFPLYLRTLPTLANRRVTGVSPIGQGNQWWNAPDWAVTG